MSASGYYIEDSPWPAGTTVAVYLRGKVIDGVASGPPVTEAVVSSTGTLLFLGLTAGTFYTAVGSGAALDFSPRFAVPYDSGVGQVANEIANPDGKETPSAWNSSSSDASVSKPRLVIDDDGEPCLEWTVIPNGATGSVALIAGLSQATAAPGDFTVFGGQIKVIGAGGPLGVGAQATFQSAAIANLANLDIASRTAHPDEWVDLVGYAEAPALTRFVYLALQVFNVPKPTPNVVVRTRRAFVFRNVTVGLPGYGGHRTPGWRSQGTVESSPSFGPIVREQSKRANFRRGYALGSLLTNTDLSNQQVVDLLVDGGANAVRFAVSMAYGGFSSGTAGGSINWAESFTATHDDFYERATAAGLRCMPVVYGATAYMTGGTPSPTTAPSSGQRADWAARVAQIAERWSDLDAIEIWNEPNHPAAWGTPDAASFAALLAATYSAVKAVNADLPVISGGVSAVLEPPPDGGYISAYQFVASLLAAGGADYLDGIGVHPYPSANSTVASGLFLTILNGVRYAQLLAGDTTPLWVTELGASTGPGSAPVGAYVAREEQQAVTLQYHAGICEQQPDVQGFFAHMLTSADFHTPFSYEEGFEVVTRGGVEKRAYAALRRQWKGTTT